MNNHSKKFMRRVIAGALVLTFVGGFAPIQAVADIFSSSVTVKATGENTQELDCELDSEGVLTIKSGTYVNPVLPDQYRGSSDIKAVKAGSSVILSGSCEELFNGLYNAEEIDLTGVDTSAVTNMKKMFSYNYNLTKITFGPGFSTANVTDMSGMFSNMREIQNIDVSGFNTSDVTDMNHMFESCNSLESLDLSGFNTSRVTNMGSMFYDCYNLKTLTLSADFKTAAVTKMYSMFSNCSKLQSLDLGSFTTPLVTDMSNMFSYCSGLEELNLSGFETASVTDMDYMFSSCGSLKKLDLSSFIIDGDTDTNGMFGNCSSLGELVLPSGFTVDEDMELYNISPRMIGWAAKTAPQTVISGDGTYASGLTGPGTFVTVSSGVDYSFDVPTKTLTLKSGTLTKAILEQIYQETRQYDVDYYYEPGLENIAVCDGIKLSGDCTEAFYFDSSQGLNFISFGNIDTSEVTNMSGMFKHTSGNIDVSSFDTSNVESMSEMFKECQYDDLDLSSFDTAEVTDMNSMFESSSPRVTVGNKFNTGNVTDMSRMFDYFGGEFDYSKLDTSSVTNMSSMFYGCNSSEVDVSNFDFSSVTDISYMFSYSQIEEADLSGAVTSETISLSHMFASCTDLKRVMIGAGIKSSSMCCMFNNCEKLENVEFAQGFDSSAVTDFSDMFSGCTGLTELDLSSLDVSSVTDIENWFRDCESLVSITLPEFSDPKFTSLSGVFAGCSSLASIDLSKMNINSGMELYSMSSMFKGCSSLEEIDISNFVLPAYEYFSMNEIFSGCTALKRVLFCSLPSNYNNQKEGYKYEKMFSGAENLIELSLPGGMSLTKNQMLENSNYIYSNWHRSEGEVLSYNQDYAVFTNYNSGNIYRDRNVYTDFCLEGVSLSLEGLIGVNFYASLPAEMASEDSKAYVLMSGPEGEKKIMLKDAECSKKNGYKFTYGVAARSLHDNIEFKVYDGENAAPVALFKRQSGNMAGVENNTLICRVQDYIDSIKNNSGAYDEKLVDLVKALEVYGNYAQKKFGYEVDSIDPSCLIDLSAITADDVSGYKFRNYFYSGYTSLPDGLEFVGYSLLLRSETALRLYFRIDDPEKYDIYAYDGFTELRRNSAGLYYIEKPDYASGDLSAVYGVYITDKQNLNEYGDPATICYLTCGPMSYVYSVLTQCKNDTDKADLVNVVKALKNYSDAASRYFRQ